eukprot:Em0463g2a
MLLLSIGTVAPALSKREVSVLVDIREGVTLLGNVANGSRSLIVNYLNNETSGVLFTVCLLRNYTWSRNTISQLNYDALIAIKDAVINNSCSWLSSLGQSISCDQLSDYCSTTEVMIKINTGFTPSSPPDYAWIGFPIISGTKEKKSANFVANNSS